MRLLNNYITQRQLVNVTGQLIMSQHARKVACEFTIKKIKVSGTIKSICSKPLKTRTPRKSATIHTENNL